MQVTFLKARERLTKAFGVDSEGNITKSNYPMVRNFTSITHAINNIDEFYKAIETHAADGNCLLKGRIARELQDEPRRGTTISTAETQWLCIDIDGAEGINSAEDVIEKCLPPEFKDVSYIEHMSSSTGFDPKYSAHLFFILDAPLPAPQIKEYLKLANIESPLLRQQLKLTKNGVSLSWVLDISACQNDKLIYIAPPTLQDGLKDRAADRRINLIKRQNDTVSLNTANINAAKTDEVIAGIVDQLRKDAGLKKKQFKTKYELGHQVLDNPDRWVLLSEPFEERGFVYLPITSNPHAYFHPIGKPQHIFNFKSEPVVRTRDVLPEYWEQVSANEQQTQYLVFRDIRRDCYYNGFVSDNTLEIYPVAGKDRMRDFMTLHGQQMPDPIPDYRLVFDPQSDVIFDKQRGVVNLFKETELMKQARKLGPAPLPPQTKRLISSVLGNDDECLTYFLNWLAYIAQYRAKTKTAWIFQGIEGTGKGMLFHKVLKPMLGPEYCVIMRLQDFDDSFNAWRETCLLLFVDEVQIDSTARPQRIINILKNMITEPTAPIRAMRTNPYQASVYENIIFATNEVDSMRLSETDRRYNVGPRQEIKYRPTNRELDQIDEELMDFTRYIMHLDVDLVKLQEPLKNEARELLRKNSQTSQDQFIEALKEGNFGFFADMYFETGRDLVQQEKYKTIIKIWANRIVASTTGEIAIPRDELKLVYEYIQLGRDMTTNKFSALLNKNGLPVQRLHVPEKGQTVKPRGIKVAFEDPEDEYVSAVRGIAV